MKDERFIQADWVGKSDWEYYGWKTEEEEEAEELAYDDYIDRLMEEQREEEALIQMEKKK